MIRVEHITKKYGARTAVDDISFRADKGKIYGFLGPNGAGKTTTMNMMTGYISSTSGSIRIGGFDIATQPKRAKSMIGYLPEFPPLYPDMTIGEYLMFAAGLKGVAKRERREAVQNVMAKAELTGTHNRLIRNLSKGYKQRVGLAQAVIGDPQVIILDEPTVGLDPEQQKEMFDYIRTLRDDHVVILSSHILSDVSAVCDEVWILNGGRLVAEGRPEDLRDRMTAGQHIALKIGGQISADELKEKLAAIPGLTSVTTAAEGDEITAVISSDGSDDIRPVVSRAIFDSGLDLLSMNKEETSLEEVFFALTAEEAHADAAEATDATEAADAEEPEAAGSEQEADDGCDN